MGLSVQHCLRQQVRLSHDISPFDENHSGLADSGCVAEGVSLFTHVYKCVYTRLHLGTGSRRGRLHQ